MMERKFISHQKPCSFSINHKNVTNIKQKSFDFNKIIINKNENNLILIKNTNINKNV